MKKITAFVIIMLMFTAIAYAEEIPIDISINGSIIKTSSEPIIIAGRTYAPIRSVFEAMGADFFVWDDSTKTAEISFRGDTIKITNASNICFKNNEQIKLNSKSFILDDRLFIPVRAFSELVGCSVNWDETYKIVKITNDNITVNTSYVKEEYTEGELYWMSHIISAESASEPFSGQVAVGDVILNRVESEEFPNTIYDVIFDSKYSVQFEPVLNGSIYNAPSKSSIAAAKISLRNSSSVSKALYFYNPSIAESSWISNNREYYVTIGKHDFYL